MNKRLLKASACRIKRKQRVRKNLRGTADRPRLSVNKTNAHIHAQLIDDANGKTLGAVSTLDRTLRSTENNHRCRTAAKVVGEHIAKICSEKKISHVIFDRGPSKYTGVMAELADAARAGGVKL